MRRELRKTLCVLMAAITLSSSIQLPVRASEPVGEVQETAAGEAALEPAKLAEETEQSVTDNASDAAQELSSLAEEMAIEDIKTEETAAEDIIIEETATEETTIEETTIEGTTIEDTVIEGTTIEDTVIEETTIEETASREDTVPTQETASQEVPDATQETASSEEQTSVDEIVTEEEPYTTEDITQEETEEDGIAPHIMDFVEIKDIARGSYKNVSWVINKDGMLTVKGYGEYCIYPQHAHTPWYPYREQIKTAVVRLFGVENPSFMFEDCVNLTSVDLSRFDTSYSTNFTAMFSGCKSLKKIDLSGMDTSNATRLNNMFSECSSLEELDLSNFDTSKVTGMDHMFAFDRNLRHIRFGKDFTTVNVKCSLEMFRSCQSLEELDLSGFSMPNNTCMKGMFSGCSNLKKLTFGENFSTEKAEDVRYMFSGCDGLRTLDLSTFDLNAAKYTEWMLSSCMPLLELHTPRNVKADIKMPQGIWQTQEGQSVTSGYLPKNQSKSIKLTQQMHLEVTKDVTKYIFGSTLDLSDLEVEYRNSTGSIREQVKDYTTNAKSINMRVAGTKDLIVNYKGLSATVKITVKEQTVLDRFVLDKAKTVYMPGEKPNLDGIWLHGYLGNDRKILTRDYSTNLDEIDTSTPGVKKLKVWFEDASGEVDLFVMEPFQDDDIAHKRYDTLAYKIDRNGKLTMMGAEPAQKKRDWSSSQEVLDSIKTAKIIIRGADDLSELLSECHNLESVDFSGTETKYVKNFGQMFFECSSLKSVNLSGFDTGNATTMSAMFSGCKSLKNVDLSGFHTEKVYDMSRLFFECTALESVNLSSFDTSNVKRMSYMFYGCHKLTSLPVGGFNTSSVNNMEGMFGECFKITAMDLSHFDTGNVTNMSQMFFWCKGLTSLDLSSFRTQNVTNMSRMFDYCINLASLKLSGLDTRNLTNMSKMFSFCSSLKALDMSGFNTQKVTNMDAMFYDCRSLTSIDLTMFDTRNVTNMRYLFGDCKNLEKLDLSKFNTQKLENASYMFYGCKKLTSLDISGFDTRNVTTMREMFHACTVLEEIDLSGIQTGKVTDMAFMFAECVNMSSLNLDSFDVQNVNDFSNMFDNCRKLKKLNLSGFDMGGATSDKSVMSLVEQCGELDELWTPRNIKVSISLGGTWYDDQGNACTEFPKNTSTSVHLRKHKAAEQPDNEESSSAEESSDTAESSEESSSNEESATTEESSKVEESSSEEESSPSEESSSTQESSSIQESSSDEESATTEESSKVEESPSDEESASNEESSFEESSSEESATTEESSDVEESASSEETSSVEESPTVEESPETEENSTNEESSSTEESSSNEESSLTEENSSNEEHETAEEKTSEEENEGSGESSSETERSPYTDKERIDLQKAGGKLSAIQSKIYDGFAYTPSVKVTVTEGGRKRTLTEGTDYSVTYQQNTDAGQGTAIVRGNGLYKGTLKTTFQITPKPMKKLKVVTGSMTVGSQSEPPVYVYDGTKRLESGKDYKLTYAKDLTAKASKTAKVTVTAMANYEGSSTVKLAVYEGDASHIINPEHVTLQTQSLPYTGKAQKPALTVTINGTVLRANKDYKVQYQNNKNAGTAWAVVTGKGAYKGKVVKTFEITARSKADTSLTISKIPAKTYNGKYQKPSVTVKCGKKKLVKNKDYIVSYQQNLHATANNQKAQVTVTGIGNYEGIVETAEFDIKPQKIAKAAVKGTKDSLTLTYGGTRLKEGVHYTVTYDAASAKAGSKKIKIKLEGLGDFAGSEVTKSVKAR